MYNSAASSLFKEMSFSFDYKTTFNNGNVKGINYKKNLWKGLKYKVGLFKVRNMKVLYTVSIKQEGVELAGFNFIFTPSRILQFCQQLNIEFLKSKFNKLSHLVLSQIYLLCFIYDTTCLKFPFPLNSSCNIDMPGNIWQQYIFVFQLKINHIFNLLHKLKNVKHVKQKA